MRHVRGRIVRRRLLCTVMSDFTPQPTTAASSARTRARSRPAQAIVVAAAAEVHDGLGFRGSHGGGEAGVFVLGAVTPDRGFLLAHERDV